MFAGMCKMKKTVHPASGFSSFTCEMGIVSVFSEI